MDWFLDEERMLYADPDLDKYLPCENCGTLTNPGEYCIECGDQMLEGDCDDDE